MAKQGWREAALEVLADGEWHTFSQLYYAVERLIPPEVATKEYERYRIVASEEIEERLRLGKGQVVIGVLSNLNVEQQGFRNDRYKRSFRFRPENAKDMTTIKYGARVVLRALLAYPPFLQAVTAAIAQKTLNPAQEFWALEGLEAHYATRGGQDDDA